MTFSLPRPASEAGYRLLGFDKVGSTSEEALAAARRGERGPLWVVSSEQTAGRGRRGTVWATPRGNLAASLLVTTKLGPAVVAQLGFVAGLALCRALDRCCGPCLSTRSAPDEGRSGSDRFFLKWPNDVLGDGGKLSGILLQTEQSGAGRAVVVGIGVNVVAAPQGLPYPATSLKELGCATDAEALFSALAAETAEACAVWNEGRSFDAIRKLWLARAAGLGGAVAVRTGEGVARGVFETIDEHGQLVVRVSDGSTRRISAGEVHFGMTATIRDEAGSQQVAS